MPGIGWKDGGRGDVEHRAATALDHPGRVARLEVDQRLAVEPHHRDHPLALGARATAPESPKPALLTRISTVEAELADAAPRVASRSAGVAEIGGDHLGAHAVLARRARPASSRSRSSRRATRVTPWPRLASSRAISAPIPDGGAGDERGRRSPRVAAGPSAARAYRATERWLYDRCYGRKRSLRPLR